MSLGECWSDTIRCSAVRRRAAAAWAGSSRHYTAGGRHIHCLGSTIRGVDPIEDIKWTIDYYHYNSYPLR